MKTPIRSMIIMAAGALSAGHAMAETVAPAADADSVQSTVALEYAPAMLQSESGAKVIYAQLRSAARRVCADAGDAAMSTWMFERQKCAAKALEAAVKDLDSPVVTQMHIARFD
jgi:UrcA family protein